VTEQGENHKLVKSLPHGAKNPHTAQMLGSTWNTWRPFPVIYLSFCPFGVYWKFPRNFKRFSICSNWTTYDHWDDLAIWRKKYRIRSWKCAHNFFSFYSKQTNMNSSLFIHKLCKILHNSSIKTCFRRLIVDAVCSNDHAFTYSYRIFKSSWRLKFFRSYILGHQVWAHNFFNLSIKLYVESAIRDLKKK
jgi:hypothetical protein